MDNELSDNDPYRNMNTAQDDVRPEFLNRVGGKNGAKEKVAQGALKAAEAVAATAGLSDGAVDNGLKAAKGAEESSSGYHRAGFSNNVSGKRSLLKGKSKKVGIVFAFLVALIGAFVVFLGSPIFSIGNFDFNLMDSIGFLNRIGILDKIASFVFGAELEDGIVSDQIASKMAEHGLTVGQVASNGDFVRTNAYIANIENVKDLAVLGNYRANPSDGQLSVLYENKVVDAKDFVATLESDPKMYMAFLDAANIGAAYWYSRPMEEQLEELGVNGLRSLFADYESTGDPEKDNELYQEKKESALNDISNLSVSGVPKVTLEPDQDGNVSEPEVNSSTVSDKGDSNAIISDVADQMEGNSLDEANGKAAQSLNAVMSAGEPYLAAKDFMFAEGIVQLARIEGKGPVNEFMNDLYTDVERSYVDAFSREVVKSNGSILSSATMSATLGHGKFSKKEAASFSRDSSLITMNSGGSIAANANMILTALVGREEIEDTVIVTEGQKKSDVLMGISGGNKASSEDLGILNNRVNRVMVEKNSDMFLGVDGGVRIPEGGEFILNMVDSHLIGALATNEEHLAEYHREAEKMVARRAEAERATKSPFDISSPYTFMGSLTRSIASTIMKGRVGNGGVGGSTIGVIANMAGDSMKGLYNTAIADGDDGSYEMATGDYCETASVAGASSSVLCGPKYALTTKYISMTDEELEGILKEKGALSDNGEIVEDSGLGELVAISGRRQSTVGIKDSSVCETYRQLHNDFLDTIFEGLAKFFHQYKACDGIAEVGTNSKYTLGSADSNDQDLEYYATYVARDMVKSLLDGTESSVSKFKKSFYEKHPLDNSREGIIARRSGLTKAEVRQALAYADYLTMLANYNPATRYAFGGVLIEKPERPLVEHSGQVAVDLYVMWQGQTEYDDLRGRIRVV